MKRVIICLLFTLSLQIVACEEDAKEQIVAQITVDSKPILLTREAGEFTLPVNHNVEFEINVIQETDWLSRELSRSITNTNVIFTYKKNDTGETRDAEIEIKYAGIESNTVITVTQSASSYMEDTRKVLNPDIGFYKAFGIQIADNGSDEAFLSQAQIEQTSIKHSLLHLRFGLQAFSTNGGGTDKDLPANVLTRLTKTFENLRQTNAIAIIRFSYDVTGKTVNGGYKNNEPSIELIKTHISQIGAVVNENLDVISGVETGMLGPWGEQHSTPMSNTAINYYHLIEAWLDSTNDIGVTIRTPSHFLKWLNEKYTLSYTTGNIGAFNLESHPSVSEKDRTRRVGCYNDGYLGSASDLGTFQNRAQEVQWLSKVTRHTLYGGEVVADGVTGSLGEYNRISFLEVEAFKTRTSYLNIDWNYEYVIKKWQDANYTGVDRLYNNGVLSDFNFVENRLGYRLFLSLISVGRQIDISKGQKLNIEGTLNNVGFANVVNKKKVQIILDNGANKYYINTNFDVCKIEPKGQKDFNLDLDLPQGVVAGTYKVYMKVLSIYEKTVSNRRTIEFANSPESWNKSLGANFLGSVEVANSDIGDLSGVNFN